MRDFTLEILIELLKKLKDSSFKIIPFKDYFDCDSDKIAVLRHDVDKLPGNSLKFAEIQHDLGIKATYYFRIVKESFDVNVIKQIVSLGHEIGYHYEDLTLAKGDYEKAYELFNKNLDAIREYYPVKTICMHGSPLTKWDNKDLWKKYSYRESGIIAEPYFDLDFNKQFYITDTGRRWDGGKVSVRDKVKSSFTEKYKTTKEIIKDIEENKFPFKTMFTFHPQRWTNEILSWSNELVKQKTKNIIKKVIVRNTK
jgi:hypothetical protein